MRTPPADLSVAELRAALAAGWGIVADSVEYAAVGFGSHHWLAVEPAGRRWFLTADAVAEDLVLRRDLRAALETALVLRREAGLRFVAAPVPRTTGGPLEQVGRYLLAVYPHLVEVPHDAGERGTDRVVGLVAALHAATAAVRKVAGTDDMVIPGRWSLVEHAEEAPRLGPYAAPFGRLVAGHRGPLSAAWRRYDALARLVAADRGDWVVTHGEPKANNIMVTASGPIVVDWDTVRLAPAARDLWMTGGLDRYLELTGRRVPPEHLEFYRLRWDLADLCSFGCSFRRPHQATADTDLAWQGVVEICERLAAGTPGPPWAAPPVAPADGRPRTA